MDELSRQTLKLGFIGLGKYGYAVMRAILRTGHHSPDDIFYEMYDESTYNDNPQKKGEVEKNYEFLTKYFKTDGGQAKDRSKSVEDLVKEVAGDEGSQGVLILSLNKERGTKVLGEIKEQIASAKGTLWLFSSISHLTSFHVVLNIGHIDG